MRHATAKPNRAESYDVVVSMRFRVYRPSMAAAEAAEFRCRRPASRIACAGPIECGYPEAGRQRLKGPMLCSCPF